ncbi:family 10 glycosylhydrolase, partial [Enterococcus faecalis]|uniref:family 10 glycosylhydrolase n=1 Tax=Enterococcus faecalis TaxID=1351 RepID=UPI001AD6574E
MQKLDTCATEAQPHLSIRGIWHRPNVGKNETNLAELCQVIDRFADAGINTVFLETFYHGKAVFKTEKVPYHTGLREYSYGDYPDYLTAFVTEADKRGIKVHAWVRDFYVGFLEDFEFVVDHRDWLLINQAGGIRHTTEGQGFGGYIFLDPANPAVREFLVDLI